MMLIGCRRNNETNMRQETHPAVTRSVTPTATVIPLPSWDWIIDIGQLYLLYCESQPLPLFHRDTFLESLKDRDPEVVYAMLALSTRFLEQPARQGTSGIVDHVNNYAEAARHLVMRRVSEGPVELSTLQSLCLLSLVDFTSRLTVSGTKGVDS